MNEINPALTKESGPLEFTRKKLELTKQAKRALRRELKSLEEDDSEDTIKYLEWVTTYRWGKQTTDNFSMAHAQQVLDAAHFIMEFIAVGKLSGKVNSKVLCLVGPAGVGKNPIAQTIADVLERKFHRMDLGGVKDAAELWGHRRTYKTLCQEGSSMSCVILAVRTRSFCWTRLKRLKRLPLFKSLPRCWLCSSRRSASRSRIITLRLPWICRMCCLSARPTLWPRCRACFGIVWSGYNDMEKVTIARDFMVKKIGEKYGLDNHGISIDENVLVRIVRGYCPEPGLRNLKRVLEKIAGKVAVKPCQFQEDCEASGESSTKASAQQEVSADRGDKVDGPTETATENQAQAETDSAYDLSNEVSQPKQVPDFMKVTSKDVARYLGARHPLARTFSEETVVD